MKPSFAAPLQSGKLGSRSGTPGTQSSRATPPLFKMKFLREWVWGNATKKDNKVSEMIVCRSIQSQRRIP